MHSGRSKLTHWSSYRCNPVLKITSRSFKSRLILIGHSYQLNSAIDHHLHPISSSKLAFHSFRSHYASSSHLQFVEFLTFNFFWFYEIEVLELFPFFFPLFPFSEPFAISTIAELKRQKKMGYCFIDILEKGESFSL